MPIANNVKLGQNVRVPHPEWVDLYGGTVGEAFRLGAFVEIQKTVQIGARREIASHSFVCEGVAIGDKMFIGHGVMVTNDPCPLATNAEGSPKTEADRSVHPTRVRARDSTGSNATILSDFEIGYGALVGAGSMVTRSVPDFAIVAGVPAKIVGDIRRRAPARPDVTATSGAVEP